MVNGVGRVCPSRLDGADEGVLVDLGSLVCLLALGLEVVLKLGSVPLAVRSYDLLIPVLLDQALQVLAISRRRVGNVVVRQPALELSLVPFVVSYKLSVSSLFLNLRPGIMSLREAVCGRWGQRNVLTSLAKPGGGDGRVGGEGQTKDGGERELHRECDGRRDVLIEARRRNLQWG